MANTITSLIADLYVALDVVSREQVGFIPSVTLDPAVSRAAVGQNVTTFVTPAATATDITPGVTPPDDGDQTLGHVTMQITKARRVPLRWNGEQTLALNNNGPGQLTIKQAQLTQGIRTLTNEMEADIAALHAQASRAYGSASAYSFASDLSDPANVRKILTDNGAPLMDMSLVINTMAGAKVRSLAQLTKANEAGTTTLREQGRLLDIHGFTLRESAAVKTPAAGTMASATTTAAALTVGQTVIPLATAGTGVVAAGDIITIANDTNKYVVASASIAGANPAAGDTITIAAPGIRVAQASAAYAITVVAAVARNMAFERSAIVLATRMPALPDGGDLAVDRATITDPRSGITFEVAMYAQYRQMQYEISAAWGTAMIKPAHCALMISQP
ncbi:MAG: hypothetical protein M0Z43_09790 [Acidithiobacillus sp.]|nr:hypothetical protein [Acidithiobacillus sp.]